MSSDSVLNAPEIGPGHLEIRRAADEALIHPVKEPGETPVSARVILTFTRADFQLLCRLAEVTAPPRHIWNCAFLEGSWEGQPLTIVAPAMGAPYAVAVLEKLIALGARMALALGWCGSLQPHVTNGTIILPVAALSGDGTSRYYFPGESSHHPNPALLVHLERYLENADIPWCSGPVWTTDAFYRETAALVQHYQGQGILGVEMELAALFAVGRFRRVPVAGVLVVSDELATLSWRPANRSERFRHSRRQAARLTLAAAAQWEAGHV